MNRGISIIIPCFNDGRYLREAVESVYAQNMQLPFEIIIIDDGSTDSATIDSIKSLQSFPNLQIIHHEKNKGLSEARNTGLRHAVYPYIYPLDSDDVLSTDPELLKSGNYLDRAVAALECDNEIAYAYCQLRYFEALDFVHAYRTPYDERKMLSRCSVGANIIFRRHDALSAGGYNPTLTHGEDWDFNLALINSAITSGKKGGVHYIPVPYFCYRKRNDKSSMANNQKMSVEQILEHITRRNAALYKRHYPELTGTELIARLMKDRRSTLAEEFCSMFSACAKNPVKAYQDGFLNYTRFESGRVLRKILSLFNIAAAEPLARSYAPKSHDKNELAPHT
ncbi:MAG: glycosyltransferase family 2 protein [Alphaproteobacteria bacterium]|nr:glycosyltransferase family 2 protein [Alphaproteobacteria bacterium]